MEPNARFKRYKIDDTIIFFGSARILPRDEAERRLAVAKEEGAKEEDADLVVAERNLEMSRYYEATRELARRLTEWSKSRSEEHTSELQSLMRISYAVFCLKKKNSRHPSTRIN